MFLLTAPGLNPPPQTEEEESEIIENGSIFLNEKEDSQFKYLKRANAPTPVLKARTSWPDVKNAQHEQMQI